jgi:polysaccharide export outer membrane protein
MLALFLICGCAAVTPTPNQDAALTMEDLEPAGAPAPIHFTLGPGDELDITVWNIPELNQTVKVDPGGEISVPMAGVISLTGKSITELAETLERSYREFYVDPDVTVSVRTNRSNKVSVLGEVREPGVFAVDKDTRLMEALAMAGDITERAEPRTVALIRGDLDSPQIYLLDVKALISDGDMRQNMLLQRGDVLYVPRSFISNVDAFFEHMHVAIRPVVEIERGIALWPAVEDALRGKDANTITVVR